MKALSVRQPHAGRIARGEKRIELRSWYTHYRGPLLICAARTRDPGAGDEPRGVALCIVDLLDVRPARASDRVAACVPVPPGSFAWTLGNPLPVSHRPVLGKLSLFTVDI